MNQDLEDKRISKIFLKKKSFADTVVQTTHMLKKCVVVPREEMKNEQLAFSSFKRGVMQFEDYNYALFNPYILIETREDEQPDKVQVPFTERELNRARVPEYMFDNLLQPCAQTEPLLKQLTIESPAVQLKESNLDDTEVTVIEDPDFHVFYQEKNI